MGKQAKDALKDLQFLQSKGYAIPLPALGLVAKQEARDRGIVQVYTCQYDGHRYESPVKVSQINCPNGHKMKLLWNL